MCGKEKGNNLSMENTRCVRAWCIMNKGTGEKVKEATGRGRRRIPRGAMVLRNSCAPGGKPMPPFVVSVKYQYFSNEETRKKFRR